MQDTNHQITDIHDQVERFFECDTALFQMETTQRVNAIIAARGVEYRLLRDLHAMIQVSGSFSTPYTSTGE